MILFPKLPTFTYLLTMTTAARKAALLAQQTSRTLTFAYNGDSFELRVPASDVEDRGLLIQEGNSSEQIAARVRIERSIRKYFLSSEEYKHRHVAGLCQDVVLLWHFEDPRVQLSP